MPQIGYYNNLNAAQKSVVDAAIAVIQAQGGTVVMTDIPSRADGTLAAWGICAGAADSKANDDTNCSVVLKYGFKRDFNQWLDSLGDASDIDTLTELMAFNLANAGNNAIKYGQTRFDISQEMNLVADAARYAADRAKDIFLTATHGIDEVMAAQDLDALLFGGASSADLAARPGYPTVVVPFGFVPNVPAGIPAGFNPLPQPYGISFTGSAFDEPTLIKLALRFRAGHAPTRLTRQRTAAEEGCEGEPEPVTFSVSLVHGRVPGRPTRRPGTVLPCYRPSRYASFTPLLEELLHQGAALVLAYAAADSQSMVESRGLVRPLRRDQRTRFRLDRPEDHGGDARVHHRTDAHHARLHRDVQRRASQTVVARAHGRLAQRHHLGMGGRILRGDWPVEAGADDAALDHDDGPHRHLA